MAIGKCELLKVRFVKIDTTTATQIMQITVWILNYFFCCCCETIYYYYLFFRIKKGLL